MSDAYHLRLELLKMSKEIKGLMQGTEHEEV